MLALSRDARPADAPLHKSLATPSQESEAIQRHEPSPISRMEIFQAIQNDLAQRGILGRAGLRPGDLKIQSSVPVLKDEMGLRVKRIGFDPLRRETVFELWTSQEPQYLPFEVTTRRDPQAWGLGLGLDERRVDAGRGDRPTICQGGSRAASKPSMLVKPGRSATLIMLGQNVRITTTVVPLQLGSKGQQILVRDVATARVMTAEVVDEGLLRTGF
jgi:hypothetical protein